MPFLSDELVTKEKWQKEISLKNHTFIKTGGNAKYFVKPSNIESVKRAVDTAKKLSLKTFVLGGGSKTLFSDDGFNGLVISTAGLNSMDFSSGLLHAESGVKVNKIIEFSVKNGYSGLEFLYTVPCTIGGAVKMNAGAFGYQTADFVESVTVYDGVSVKTLTNKECGFSYRKSNLDNLIILSVTLRLVKSNGALGKCRYYKLKRQCSQPLSLSLGSTFKNPQGLKAGELIEKCNLKGQTKGGAEISQKHANFILNISNATSSDVFFLKQLAKQRVYEKFKITLEDEIIYIGE